MGVINVEFEDYFNVVDNKYIIQCRDVKDVFELYEM